MRTLTRLMLAVVIVAVALGGCRRAQEERADQADQAPPGSSSGSLTVSGLERTYHLYVPALPPNGAVPLVVMLHGGFGSGEQAKKAYGWDGEADRQGFVVVYPDGRGRAWSVGGGCCGEPGAAGQDDVAFIEALVRHVSGQVPIDAARVYATGMSNGAMMAYRLACDSEIFAGIAPVAGTMLGECPDPAPISILHIHGLADENVRFDGGSGTGYAKIDGPPVASVIERARTVNHCDPPVVTVDGEVTTSHAECARSRSVDLITIAGAGHQWPGAEAKPVAERVLGADPPTRALNATETIWRFFAAHPSPA